MKRLAFSTLAVAATLLFGCADSDNAHHVTAPSLEPELLSVTAEAGVSGPSFYVDGELYRTVGTPTSLPQNAPGHSFDVIYDLSAYQDHNVSTVAPGYPGYNGGRWHVHAVSFEDYGAALATYDTNASGDFDSAGEVEAAIAGGAAVDEGIVASFECPVIPVPRGRQV